MSTLDNRETAVSTQVDRQALLTALTTEHYNLQGARASTLSESTSRAGLYVSALSSSLIALGFISQVDKFGSAFRVFSLIVLPTLYVLGIFTFVRLVQSSAEDLWYGRAINRIRHYYLEIAREEASRFTLGGHDDLLGVLANMGLARPSRWQMFFALAEMISFLNAVVGGSTAAFVISILGGSIALAGGGGVLVGLLSVYLCYRWEDHFHRLASERTQAQFPSPES